MQVDRWVGSIDWYVYILVSKDKVFKIRENERKNKREREQERRQEMMRYM